MIGSCPRETISQVDFLVKHTAYNSEEVVEWHNAFLEDNPEGTLGKVGLFTQWSLMKYNWDHFGTKYRQHFPSGQNAFHVFFCFDDPQGIKNKTMRVCTQLSKICNSLY